MEKFLKNQQIPLTQVIDPNTGQAYYAPQNVVYTSKTNPGATTLKGVIVDSATSSSYALTASYAMNGGGGGSTNTGSLLTTASFSNPNLTFTKGNGSTFNVSLLSLIPTSASYAATASLAPLYLPLVGGTISGDVTVLGTASINTLIVNQIGYSSGSNQLGDAANDTQTLYGSVIIPTGSLTVTGSTRITGSLGVTGSIAVNGPLYFASDAAGSNGLSFVRNSSNNWTWGTSGIGNVMTIAGNTTTLPQVVYTTNGLNVTPGGNSTTLALGVTVGAYPSAIIASFISGSVTALSISGSGMFGTGSFNYLGNISIGATSTLSRLYVKGTGTTSATTALLVQNANASASLTVRDDGLTQIPGGGKLDFNNSSTQCFITTAGGSTGLGSRSLILPGTGGQAHWAFYNTAAYGIQLLDSTGDTLTISPGNSSTSTIMTLNKSAASGYGGGGFIYYQTNSSNRIYTFGNPNSERGDETGVHVKIAAGAGGTVGGGTYGTGGNVYLEGGTPAYSSNRPGNILISTGITGSKVGLGTPTPSASLHISGASSAALLKIDSPTVNNILYVSGSGNVGIGTGTPTATLDVSGSGRFTGNLTVTGSLNITGGITGSLLGTASYATQALSASYAPSSPAFPYTGSARITGSLNVIGATTVTGSLEVSGSFITYDESNVKAIQANTTKRTLFDTSANPSVNWGGRGLYTPTSILAVDWNDNNYLDSNVYQRDSKLKQTQNTISSTLNNLYTSYLGDLIEVDGSDVIFAGGTADGMLVYLDTNATWYPVVQNSVSSSKMLGIACGVAGPAGFVLLEGHVVITSTSGGPIVQSPDHGLPIYIKDNTTTGEMSTIVPTTTGGNHVIRILGHCYWNNSGTATQWMMKFRPSNDWVLI